MTTRSRHAPLRHASKASPLRRWLTTTTALAGVLPVLMIAVPALANPQGGSVVEGQATITTAPNQLTVNQASDKAVINWQSFSIGAGETTRFVQPSASSIALNRVTGDQVSQILGTLTANGRVILVNPNGVFFGKDSRIDVAALVASTHDIKNSEFMAGRLNFDIPGKIDAQIINEGSLSAKDGGLVALVAPSLRNSGIISARLGRVALASAGSGVTVDLYGDNLILFQADSKLAQQVKGPDGQPVAGLIDNSGQIYADGGRVLLTANAAKGVVDKAINMTGIVQARTVEQQGGEIVLKGDDGGVVEVAGKLDASGKEAGQKGGIVHVLGEVAALTDSARIDVSGDAGGGTALVGGDYLGKGAVRNADVTYMAKGAQINASALTNGDGGKAILWADHTTRSYGKILALGGWGGGNGGFVETSGKVYLAEEGWVDASAPRGSAGKWLLDPGTIYIRNNVAEQNLNPTPLFAECGTSMYCKLSSSSPAYVNASAINAALSAGTDVDVTTHYNDSTSDLYLEADIIFDRTLGAQRDVWFSISASRNVFVTSGSIKETGQSPSGAKLKVAIFSDWNNDEIGSVYIGSNSKESETIDVSGAIFITAPNIIDIKSTTSGKFAIRGGGDIKIGNEIGNNLDIIGNTDEIRIGNYGIGAFNTSSGGGDIYISATAISATDGADAKPEMVGLRVIKSQNQNQNFTFQTYADYVASIASSNGANSESQKDIGGTNYVEPTPNYTTGAPYTAPEADTAYDLGTVFGTVDIRTTIKLRSSIKSYEDKLGFKFNKTLNFEYLALSSAVSTIDVVNHVKDIVVSAKNVFADLSANKKIKLANSSVNLLNTLSNEVMYKGYLYNKQVDWSAIAQDSLGMADNVNGLKSALDAIKDNSVIGNVAINIAAHADGFKFMTEAPSKDRIDEIKGSYWLTNGEKLALISAEVTETQVKKFDKLKGSVDALLLLIDAIPNTDKLPNLVLDKLEKVKSYLSALKDSVDVIKSTFLVASDVFTTLSRAAVTMEQGSLVQNANMAESALEKLNKFKGASSLTISDSDRNELRNALQIVETLGGDKEEIIARFGIPNPDGLVGAGSMLDMNF